MNRECEKCVYHTSGSCSQWECKGTVTIDDIRADEITRIKKSVKNALNSYNPSYTDIYNVISELSDVVIGRIEIFEEQLKVQRMSECTECNEYDKEKFYCPKWCEVIKDTIEDVRADERAKTIDEYKNLIVKNLNTLTLGNKTQAEYIRIHIEEWAEQMKEGTNK